MKRLAVFVSGSGTDMQSVIDGIARGEINAEIALVVASKSGIYAIERAKTASIPVEVWNKNDFDGLEKMYEALMKRLFELNVDYVLLAGYLSILTPNIVHTFPKRIINIHPALLPKYGGVGMFGMNVHRAVIAAKEKVSGATVHFVDEGADTGEIIAQATVEVKENDTPESLQERVLTLEHILLPTTLAKLFED